MYPYSSQVQYAVKGLIGTAQPFNVDDIKELVESLLKDSGTYYDPVADIDLKLFLMSMFEQGHMPGYCLTTKPVIDEDGPKMVLEFIPENPFAILDLVAKPAESDNIKCALHPQYKDLLKFICKKINHTQDTVVRSILIKALDLIHDQMK